MTFVNNSSCFVELVDILHFHNCNIHSSRLVLVEELVCNFHIHKNIDKHLLASFLLFYARSSDT